MSGSRWSPQVHGVAQVGIASGRVAIGVHRPVGLVVKASAWGAGDPEFESHLRQDFSGSSHTSDLKIGTPVATLPGS